MNPHIILVLSIATVILVGAVVFLFYLIRFVKEERKQDKIIREMRQNWRDEE